MIDIEPIHTNSSKNDWLDWIASELSIFCLLILIFYFVVVDSDDT